MVGWHRHVKSLLHNVGKRVERTYSQSANSCCSRVDSYRSAAELPCLRRFLKPSSPILSRPVYQYYQQLGISTSRKLLADETPVQSPLLAIGSGNGDDEQNKPVKKQEKVQAVLKCIKQSPKKMNLVAALVRGMRVEDALLQLQVTVKRAAKTVYRVIHSARANATHNHGLDAERLLVAEAYVGKGFYKKRISYHAKGRSGIRERPECRLTVVVRETTPEEEAKIARLKVHNFRKLSKKEKRLVPHTLIETTSVWSRKVKPENKTASNDKASTMPV